MFSLREPSAAVIQRRIAAARDLSPANLRLLTLAGPTGDHSASEFAHDFSRSELGRGPAVLEAARCSFAQWVQFDLGWVRVLDQHAPIALGQRVVVLAHTAGLWSANVSRIVESENLSNRFGFVYTTTKMHVEEGQERFVVELDAATGAVHYTIEAFSRPRHPLAKIGYPFTRAMQHRFVRDSHRRMREAAALDGNNHPKSGD